MEAMTNLDGKALLDHGAAIARRYAGRIGAEAAEEIRAEAVLRALRSPAPDGRIEPWLERIYRNLLVDRWRRPQPVLIDADEENGLATTTTPEDILLAHERRHQVRAGLQRLPRQARQVLLARYYGDIDEATAAGRLGIAGTTVRTRVHRALVRLRSWLGDLRSLCPPFFHKLMGQLATVGAAPLLAAALVCGSTVPPDPPQLEITAEDVPTSAAPGSFLRQAPPPHLPRALPAPRTAPVRKPLADRATPVSIPTAVINDVLWPDAVDVIAEPPTTNPPCLIERPATFALQIEKMVEDNL